MFKLEVVVLVPKLSLPILPTEKVPGVWYIDLYATISLLKNCSLLNLMTYWRNLTLTRYSEFY